MFTSKQFRYASALIASVMLLCASGVRATEPRCSEQDTRYELLPLATRGAAVALNDRGHVISAPNFGDNSTPSFFWQCASGASEFAGEGRPLFINNRDQIVSVSSGEAFIWSRARGTQFVGEGTPWSLNDWSDVILNKTGEPHGEFFLWTAGTGAVALRDVTGVRFIDAKLNNRRQIGGYAGGYAIWSARGGLHVTPTFPDFPSQNLTVVAFNERSDLLNALRLSDDRINGPPRIVPRNGEHIPLPFPNSFDEGFFDATDFNNRRQVVGLHFTFTDPPIDNPIPIVWDPAHGAQDLNVQVFGQPSPYWGMRAITAVNAINEWGWIAGSASDDTPFRGYPVLLVPVPAGEPYYRNLKRLHGPPLCRALTSLQIRAAARALVCGRESAKP